MKLLSVFKSHKELKTLYVQEPLKGLKKFYISQDIKALIKNKLELIFKKARQKKKLFLDRKDIRKIKFAFKKFDKNNFYLSNILYFQYLKFIKFKMNNEFQKIITIAKLLGLWKSNSFNHIKKIINLILKEIDLEVDFTKIKIFCSQNNTDIDNQIKTKNLGLVENLNFVGNTFLALLEKIKTKKFDYDFEFIKNLIELNYLEDQKSQYFIQNQKGTIFGNVSQKKIIFWRNRQAYLEKKFSGNLVKNKDQDVIKNIISKQEKILSKLNKTNKQINNYLQSHNIEQKEYEFIFEQTGKPYFKDVMPLNNYDRLFLLINYLLLLIWSFIVALPIYYVAYNAFNEYSTTVLSLKGFKFSFANFDYLFNETMFTTWFTNTITIAIIVTIINLISSSFLAYALSRFRFTGRKIAFKTLIILNMFPSIAGLTSYIVLNQLLQSQFNSGPYVIMCLVYAGTNLLAFSFVIKNYLDTISKEIDEAAKMDGASSFRTFITIIIPLIAPILGIVALQSFMIPFVDILMPKFFLSRSEDYTLPLGLTFIKNNPDLTVQNQGAYTAGGMLVAIPMTIVYFIADYLMKQNKTQGAIKG